MIQLLVAILVGFCSVAFAGEPVFKIHDEGKEFPVDYSKYGEMKNIGTAEYEYVINNDMALAEAIGDGLFPNNFTIYQDPAYKTLIKERRMVGSKWDYVNDSDYQACFHKWATVEDEDPGVKLFYTAQILDKSGNYRHAAKAYYACIVHFPRSVGWTYWKTPWYVGVNAVDRLEVLLREHPELGYSLVDASIFVENGFDIDLGNDVFEINPGRLVKTEELPKLEKNKGKVTRTLGGENGLLSQYEDGTWEFSVGGTPMLLKAMSYKPAPVMQSYDEGTMSEWVTYDANGNGISDAAYETWVDKNENNVQDADEPTEGDMKLMGDMGVNVLRIYHWGEHKVDKKLYQEAFDKYGLRLMIGNYIGMYNVGSGASWAEGTDYTNEEQKARMLEDVKKMVEAFKDEPYVCMWVLGNENNYGGVFGHTGGVGNAGAKPRAYYEFVNDVAKWIKSVDKTRPVAICNGGVGFMNIFAELCPDVDVFGPNSYRGKHGFGSSMWAWAKRIIDRPVMVMEYGCPAFHQGESMEIAYQEQEEYVLGCWKDIAYHSYQGEGAGTALGGVLFQWVDGWWKSGQPPRFSPAIQETLGQWPGPFPDGWSHEEWFGVCGQGDGTQSPFIRTLRPIYYSLQKLWKK